MLLTAYVQNLKQLIILRLIFGILFGMALPISSILISEIIPLHIRGKCIATLQMMYIFGRIWMLLLAAIFLDSIASGNWRAIAVTNSVPCLICFIGSIFYIKESPRFLISQGLLQKGIEGLNQMGLLNDKNYINLNENQIEGLTQWRNNTFANQHQNKHIKDLFNKDNIQLTWRAYMISILSMLIYSGLYILIPFIFDDQNMSFLDMFYTVIIELPAVFFVILLIDRIGRLPLILLGTIISIFTVLVMWYWKAKYLLLAMITFKLFNRITFLAFMPLILESYSTIYRSMAIGTTMAVGRAAGFLSPAIVLPLYQKDPYSPFLLAAILLIIMTIIFASYPKDLTNKPLDEIENVIKIEKLD